MLDLMKNLDQNTISESPICASLVEKYSINIEGNSKIDNDILAKNDLSEVNRKITESLEALQVFDQIDTAIGEIFTRLPSVYQKLLNNTIGLFKLLMKDAVPDSTHLAKFMQIVSFHDFFTFKNFLRLSINSKVPRFDMKC